MRVVTVDEYVMFSIVGLPRFEQASLQCVFLVESRLAEGLRKRQAGVLYRFAPRWWQVRFRNGVFVFIGLGFTATILDRDH